MNRLPTDRRSGLRIVLDHLEDSHPEEHASALGMLRDPTWGATAIADALTLIAREDNLGTRVNEKAVRDYRRAAA